MERWLERWTQWLQQPLPALPWAEEVRPLGLGPAVDVYRRDGQVVVEMELPGAHPEDIDVRVHEDRVTVRAEVRHEEGVRGEGYFRTERRYGAVFRSVPLPVPVDPARAEATYRRGLLRVEVPVREDADRGGRRVPVRGEGDGRVQ